MSASALPCPGWRTASLGRLQCLGDPLIITVLSMPHSELHQDALH